VTLDGLIALVREVIRTSVPVTADTPLLSTGIVDSFQLATFLATLRTRYGARIELNEIGVDNFDTPRQMVAFLDSTLVKTQS